MQAWILLLHWPYGPFMEWRDELILLVFVSYIFIQSSTHFSSGTCVCDSRQALEKVRTCINEWICSSDHFDTFLSGERNNKVCLSQPAAVHLWKILLYQVWKESSLLGTLLVLIFCCSPTTKASFYPFLVTLTSGSVSPCPKVYFHRVVG